LSPGKNPVVTWRVDRSVVESGSTAVDGPADAVRECRFGVRSLRRPDQSMAQIEKCL
jgi:hypothetical protein